MIKSVPRKALQFAANMALEAGDQTAVGAIPEPKKVSILARTNGVANQGYWGRCVHDMSGFVAPEKSIVLDWNHDANIEIGFAENFTITESGLQVDGTLIPFTADDRASEVIYKGAAGVPYQASIVLDLDSLVITEVPDGASYSVNGQDFVGPLTVFSQWSIDGIAICPYGADDDTSVTFSGEQADSVSVQVKHLEVQPMTEQEKPAAAPQATTEQPAQTSAPQNFSREDALKYKTDFGAKGFDWYLEGISYSEAAKRFSAELQQEIEAQKADVIAKAERITALEKEIAELKTKLEFKRGHHTPAHADHDNGSTQPVDETARKFGRSEGMQKFVNRIDAMFAKN